MNTRILRMCEICPVGRVRRVKGLGQLQPVLFGYERGQPTLRIEGLEKGQWCWWALPLPRYKEQAKRLFAEMEAHIAAGTEGPAANAWREYQESR